MPVSDTLRRALVLVMTALSVGLYFADSALYDRTRPDNCGYSSSSAEQTASLTTLHRVTGGCSELCSAPCCWTSSMASALNGRTLLTRSSDWLYLYRSAWAGSAAAVAVHGNTFGTLLTASIIHGTIASIDWAHADRPFLICDVRHRGWCVAFSDEINDWMAGVLGFVFRTFLVPCSAVHLTIPDKIGGHVAARRLKPTRDGSRWICRTPGQDQRRNI